MDDYGDYQFFQPVGMAGLPLRKRLPRASAPNPTLPPGPRGAFLPPGPMLRHADPDNGGRNYAGLLGAGAGLVALADANPREKAASIPEGRPQAAPTEGVGEVPAPGTFLSARELTALGAPPGAQVSVAPPGRGMFGAGGSTPIPPQDRTQFAWPAGGLLSPYWE